MTERRPRPPPGGLQDDETSRTDPTVPSAAPLPEDSTGGTPSDFAHPSEGDDAAIAAELPETEDGILREDLYGEDDVLPDQDDSQGEAYEEEGEDEGRVSGTHGSIAQPSLADVESEGDADSTRVGRPVRLEVLEGPDAGKRRRFNGVRMLIGRSPDADLVLTDSSVSRHHVELVQGDEVVLLRDLGSGNGTLVNGEKVTERALEHEDKIYIGKTLIFFFDGMRAAELAREQREAEEARLAEEARAAEEAAQLQGEEAAAAEGAAALPAEGGPEVAATRPLTLKARALAFPGAVKRLGWKKQAMMGGAAIGVLGLSWALVSLVGRGEPPVKERALNHGALSKLEAARFHIVAGRFREAIKLLEEAEALAPGSDRQGLAQALANELAIDEKLSEVEARIEKGALTEAAELLGEIPEGSADAERKREQLTVLLAAKQLEAAETELGAALDDGDFTQARALVEGFPVEKRQELLARIDTSESEWNTRQEASERRAEELREAGEQRKQQAKAAFIDAAFSAVERKFDAADYERALLECDRVVEQHEGNEEIAERSRQLKRLIPAFVAAYEDAERKIKQGGTESAVRPLKRAKSLLARIGFSGPLAGILDGKLAAVLLATGRAQMIRNDWTGATDSFKEALELAPGDERALLALSQLQKKGAELYRQAYLQKKNDPRGAAAKLRTVLELVPAESAIGRQSKALLMELRGRH